MADKTAAAATTLAWALRDYAKATGSTQADEAALLVAIFGEDHPRAIEALNALPIKGAIQ